jgi:hypothetical protein
MNIRESSKGYVFWRDAAGCGGIQATCNYETTVFVQQVAA